MIDSLELGIPGVRLTPGDHVCAFYRGLQERDEILIPYLRAGIQAGDKCVCIVDTTDPSTVLAVLSDEIDDVDGCVDRDQLEVRSSTDAYLRSGGFSTGAMLNFWQESATAAPVQLSATMNQSQCNPARGSSAQRRGPSQRAVRSNEVVAMAMMKSFSPALPGCATLNF